MYFEKMEKNFGFGCMRLPMKDGCVDDTEMTQMVDLFLSKGFRYFDTAHIYLGGESEQALRRCLTSRYPRESYVLTNKLSSSCFQRQEEIRPLFRQQLECCGVEYFDFYLMHAQDRNNFKKYKQCQAYETALELQAEGKFRYFGISFHDTAEVLEQILTEYPQIQVVQLQLNYVDFEDVSVQSGACLEVCRKHGKPVLVMEPVKGGNLAKLPDRAQQVLDELGGGSPASYAIRFAASQEGVVMVLSGMGNMAMMEENLNTMEHFQPLTEREQQALARICGIFRELDTIACTGCRYCVPSCPQKIPIPELFACLNAQKVFQDFGSRYYYKSVHTADGGQASQCIGCGKCEKACPQHLPIRELLKTVAETFE